MGHLNVEAGGVLSEAVEKREAEEVTCAAVLLKEANGEGGWCCEDLWRCGVVL